MAVNDTLLNLVDALNTLRYLDLRLEVESYDKVVDEIGNATLDMYNIEWSDGKTRQNEVAVKVFDVFSRGFIIDCVLNAAISVVNGEYVVFDNTVDFEEPMYSYLKQNYGNYPTSLKYQIG